MKKMTLLLGVILAVNAFGSGFRDSQWGSDLASIKKAENNKRMKKTEDVQEYGKYHWDREIYSFEDSLKSAGKFDVEYVMLKDKLIEGRYIQKIKDGNLEGYKKMERILVEKYGGPQGSYIRNSAVVKDGKEEVAGERTLVWNTEGTRIELRLLNNKSYEISYIPTSKEILDFVKDAGLEKEKAKEKELMKDSDYIKNFI